MVAGIVCFLPAIVVWLVTSTPNAASLEAMIWEVTLTSEAFCCQESRSMRPLTTSTAVLRFRAFAKRGKMALTFSGAALKVMSVAPA